MFLAAGSVMPIPGVAASSCVLWAACPGYTASCSDTVSSAFVLCTSCHSCLCVLSAVCAGRDKPQQMLSVAADSGCCGVLAPAWQHTSTHPADVWEAVCTLLTLCAACPAPAAVCSGCKVCCAWAGCGSVGCMLHGLFLFVLAGGGMTRGGLVFHSYAASSVACRSCLAVHLYGVA